MLFTIVTPVLNGMPWLPAAVASVAQQRAHVEVEHLVLDGGSTDGSREWLQVNADLGFEAHFEPDAGQTDALISGFSRAHGELYGWLNADDLLEPGALAIAHRAFVENPDAVMVGGALLLVDSSGSVIGAMPTPPDPSFQGLLLGRSIPPQPATFFTADAYRECGGLDRRFQLAMDVDLWLKLARNGRYVTLPDVVLARFRVHPETKTERLRRSSARESFAARRVHGMPLRSDPALEFLRLFYVSPWARPVRRKTGEVVKRMLIPHRSG